MRPLVRKHLNIWVITLGYLDRSAPGFKATRYIHSTDNIIIRCLYNYSILSNFKLYMVKKVDMRINNHPLKIVCSWVIHCNTSIPNTTISDNGMMSNVDISSKILRKSDLFMFWPRASCNRRNGCQLVVFDVISQSPRTLIKQTDV